MNTLATTPLRIESDVYNALCEYADKRGVSLQDALRMLITNAMPEKYGMPRLSASQKPAVRRRFLELWNEAGKPLMVKPIMERLGQEFDVPEELLRGPLYDWTRDLRPHNTRGGQP